MAHLEVYDTGKHFDIVASLDLRQQDKDEVRASSGLDSEGALALSLEAQSECYVMVHEGEVFGVIGLSITEVTGEPVGVPWLLATDEIINHQFSLCRKARETIGRWYAELGVLANLVDSRNSVAIKWLKWLGFHVETQETYTMFDPDIPFYLFHKGVV